MAVLGAIIVIIILLYVLNSYWEKICNKNVTIDVSTDKLRITEKDKVQLRFEILNKKLIPLPIIKLIIKIPILFENKKYYTNNLLNTKYYTSSLLNKTIYDYVMITSLFSFQKVTKRTEFTVMKRGYYLLDDVTIELIDLFGLSKSKIKYNNSIHLIVHPKPEKLNKLLLESSNMNGEEIVRRWIMPDPILYSGIRQYTYGDSFKDIDWQATAKLGEIHVKKYDYTSDPSIIIFFDINISNSKFLVDEIYFEKGIKLLASIIEEANNINIPIGLASNSHLRYFNRDMILPDTGNNHIMSLFDYLACMTIYGNNKIENLISKYIKNCFGTNIIMLVIYELTIELYDIIKNLSRHHRLRLIIYKKSEVLINDSNIIVSYIN